ncbi:MAG TPA: hypothetical protein VNX88_07905 [Terriglobales bacterium]|jgi:hypothetical protein|nr:hypothetical protein [Terriglobales bacterium]
MPVNVSVDRRRKLVITTYSGDVTDADVAHQISQVREQAPYGPAYRAITDFTQVTQFNISSSEIRSVADSESPLAEAQRVMVAPSDVAYGTSRMFQVLALRTRPNITVVRTLAEAYAKLGIDGSN